MRANRRVSQRELAFRSAIWREGLRGYRVGPNLPGRPDMAFTRRRIAIFINGCFWHRCPTCRPPEPKANREFWQAKLDRNVFRDRRDQRALRERGWAVVVVWEHEIRPDPVPKAHQLAGQILRGNLPSARLDDFNLQR